MTGCLSTWCCSWLCQHKQKCKSMSSKMGTEQGEAGWGPGGDWCVGNSQKLWGPEGDTHHVLWCMSLLTHCKSKGLQDWSLFFSLNVSYRGPDLIEGWHYQRCNYFTSINAFYSFRWYLCPFAKVQRFILFVVCFVLFQNILMRHKTEFSSDKNWLQCGSLPIQKLLNDL